MRSSSTARQASVLSPPMLLTASSTFCPSSRTPMTTEQRDRGRLAVEPHAHDRAVEDQPHDRLVGERSGVPGVPIALHLAPGPAHNVLADRAAEQRGKRPADAARVDAGEIGARDQRLGRLACGADRRAGPCSSIPSCRHPAHADARAARRSRFARTSPSASASGCRGDGRRCPPEVSTAPPSCARRP